MTSLKEFYYINEAEDQLDLLIDPELGMMAELEDDLYKLTPNANITELMYGPSAQIDNHQYGSVYDISELMNRLFEHIDDIYKTGGWDPRAIEKVKETVFSLGIEMKQNEKKYYTWEESKQ